MAGERHHLATLLLPRLATAAERGIASGGHVVDTLTASLRCLLTSRDYSETALKAVNLGEDTDTTGIVAGGLAGSRTTGMFLLSASDLEDAEAVFLVEERDALDEAGEALRQCRRRLVHRRRFWKLR